MHAPQDPKRSIQSLPAEGALLSLPASLGDGRRVLMTHGTLRRADSPQPGAFSFYAPDFFLDHPAPWLLPDGPDASEAVREFSPGDLRERLAPSLGAAPPPAALDWQPPVEAAFDAAFEDLQAEFRSGWLAKAVPVFFEQAASPSSDAALTRRIAALLRAPETLMPYGHWSESGGILGASPELLFEIQGGVLKTMALAGTLAAPQNAKEAAAAEEAFLADSKERREHCLVVEGITETLAPFGAVKIGETAVLKLPSLWHLQTPIQVALRETPPFELLARRLHPTPALGGSPRAASGEWLRRQDQRPERSTGRGVFGGRGAFGAPFGVQCPDGSAFCLVAVRNLMWQGDTLRIGAGCGVIRESRKEREWEELRQKRESVKRLFGL